MADIADIIGLLSDSPGSSAPTPASLFRQELLEFLGGMVEEVEPSKPDFLRASNLHRLCARAEAIATVFPDLVPPDATVSFTAGQRMTLDLGSAVHAWFQNKYLGPMGKLWGHWFCLKCDRIIHTGLMPKKCEGCGRGRSRWHSHEHDGKIERFNVDNFVYVERSLIDNELGLTAHPDGLLYSSDLRDVQHLFELKTISTDGLDKLIKKNAPMPAHIIQTHVYMHLTGLRETFVVYFDKGKQCAWSFKPDTGLTPGEERLTVFHVEFDEELWALILNEVKAYWRARELATRTEPAVSADIATFARRCQGPDTQMARDCHFREKCFSLRGPTCPVAW